LRDTLTAHDVDKAAPKLKDGKPIRTEIPDPITPGLYLIVQPSGAKSWATRYSFQRAKFKLTLGSYPTIKLADARLKAQAAMRDVANGINPKERKEIEEPKPVEPRPDDYFLAAADLYNELHVSKLRAGTAAYVQREMNVAKNAWGDKLTAAITKRDIIDVVDEAEHSGAHAANQRRKVLKAFFNWAFSRDMIPANPAAGLKKTKVKARDRFLDDGELRIVWQAADKHGDRFGALVKLLILTGARRNEIAKLEWNEIQSDYIVLPPERTKTDERHRIFITPLMRSIIEQFPREGRKYVLGNGSDTPISGNVYARDVLGVKLNEVFRLHDLRRTFATGLAKLGISLPVIERCLNHKFGGILSVYQRHDFSEECKGAWCKWSEHIAKLMTDAASEAA
jgi:integrase